MNYIQFQQQLLPFKVFSTDDILKKAPDFDTRRLVEWQQKGYITKVINRWYVFSDPKRTERDLFLIANRIYSTSYVSFESALAWYGLIPEAVFSITNATSRKTRTFSTDLGTFIYHRMKPSLHFGYRLERIDNQFFKIAEPEKAILDYLYLHPKFTVVEDFTAWRINTDWLENELDREKLRTYGKLFDNKALNRRVRALYKYIDYARS